MDVHEPYMPEKRYVDMVDPAINISQDEMYALFENTLLKRDVSDQAKVSLLKRLYDVHVREVDCYLEAFFKSLDASGVLKDTAVIITSDHGDEFNEHGGLSHDDKLYSELIDVPLLVYGPGQTGTFDDIVSSVDIPPTILNLFGLDHCPAFQGWTLLPTGKYLAKAAFSEAINQKSAKGGDMSKDSYSCRVGDMKLIYRADIDRWELYNLADDPGEQHDIAGSSPQEANLQAQLKPRIRRWEK
jgi:arylsulfatase A-like enzyme